MSRPAHGWVAALVYVCAALPLVVFHVFALAPGQVPDETNHFLRVVQLSSGGIVGARLSEGSAGGAVPGAAVELLAPFDGLRFRPDVRVDAAVLRKAREARWSDRPMVDADFANTVIYPPFYYSVATLAAVVGRATGLGVLDTFFLVRLANGVAAVALSALGIAAAVRGRALLFAIVALPGTIGLFGSSSQDALLLSSLALVAGLFSRAARDRDAVRDWQRVLVAGVLGAAAAARPPYFAFAALLLCNPLRPAWSGTGRERLVSAVPLVALAAAIPLLWIVFVAAPLKVPFGVASPAKQLEFLREHPAAILVAAYHTFERYGNLAFQQFVGVLGWLDTYFSPGYYVGVACVLVVAIIEAMMSPGRGLARGEKLIVAGAVACAFCGLYVLQYLTWSAVRSDWIDGVQGRYFIALGLIIAPALPSLRRDGDRSDGSTAEAPLDGALILCWAVLVGFGLFNWFEMPRLVLARYYG
jgi:uncharacterized membrane protein